MELYIGNNRGEVESLNGRILGKLKSDGVLQPHETTWSRIFEGVDGKFAIMVGKYKDLILEELTADEQNKITNIEKDDPNWFPGVRENNNAKLSS